MSTTESVEPVQSLEAVELSTVLAALKQFGCADLFKVMRTATTEAEKRSKEEVKGPKKPKGPTPKQLEKPKAWVAHALKYASENGWESFTCENKKKGEMIVYSASELKEGKHVFPNGKPLILTQAMSLSKQMFNARLKKGSHEAVYREFEAEHAARIAAQIAANPVEVAAEPAAAPMVRKTAEEKAAELAEKKAATAAAKAAAAAAKEAAKAEKAAEKAAKPKSVPKAAIKAVEKAAPAAVAAPAAAVGVKPGPKKKAEAKPVEPAWTCPTDGNVYPWPYKGMKLLRDFENRVWTVAEDGGCGDWKGLYLPAEDRIDDSAADPYADDEEDEKEEDEEDEE
jgi:hypothetical protein